MPTQTKYSIKNLEQLKKDISQLTYNEHCEIFNIIRKDNDKLSENNNGVFINLKYLKNETLRSLISFVKYCNNTTLEKQNINQNSEIKEETTNIEQMYNRYDTLNGDSYQVFDSNDNLLGEKKSVKSSLVNHNNLLKNSKLDGIKERIYKKCISKINDTNKLDNNESVSNISSKNEEMDSSSNEYLKL